MIGRDQTARLMRAAGIEGARRSKRVKTTRPDPTSARHPDLVKREFRYGERLAEIGATPSIGTVGDSYDNALAETVDGYYKTELVRGPARSGPWRTVEDLELATLGWVHWHNTQRLHGYLGDIPPAEFENAFYAVQADREPLVGIK